MQSGSVAALAAPSLLAPNLHKRNRNATGFVKMKPRGQPCTPQVTVVVQAEADPRERDRRASEAPVCVGKQRIMDVMFAPPTDDDAAFDVYKGMAGFAVAQQGASFRGSIANEAPLRFIANMAGFARKDMSRLMAPCVNLNERHTADRGDAKVTLVQHGPQTISNTSLLTIQAGDDIFLDPNPAMTTNADGVPVPATKTPGMPASFAPPQTRPCRANGAHSMLLMLKDRIRLALHRDDFTAKIQAAMQDGKIEPIVAALNKMVEDESDAVQLPRDMPARDHARLLAPWTLLTLCQESTVFPHLKEKQRLHLWVMLMRVTLVVCQQLDQSLCRLYDDYERSLPANLSTVRERSPADDASSVHGNATRALLQPSGGTAIEALLGFIQARERIQRHVDAYVAMFHEAQHDYIARFLLGQALTPARPGDQFDVFVRRGK